MGYDRGDSFPFDFEPNGILFSSKSKGRLSPLEWHERKSSCKSVMYIIETFLSPLYDSCNEIEKRTPKRCNEKTIKRSDDGNLVTYNPAREN